MTSRTESLLVLSVLGASVSACLQSASGRGGDVDASVAVDIPSVIIGSDGIGPNPEDVPSTMGCATGERVIDRTCTVSGLPTLPAGARDEPSAAARSYAARSIQFGASGAWRTIGIDQDNTCSVGGAGPVSCMSGITPVGDGDNGRDNTLASIIGISRGLTARFDDARLSAGFTAGVATIGLRITDMSMRDDAAFNVEVLELVNGVNGLPPEPGAPTTPRWDGQDRWQIHGPNSIGPDRAAYIQTRTAFSSCGQFVARFDNPNAPALNNTHRINFISATREPAELRIANMTMVGRIQADGRLILDVSGVIPRPVMLSTLYSFGVCPPPATPAGEWMRLNQALSAGYDLLASGTSNPNAPCDSMSIAFRLEFVPVQTVGTVDSVPTSPFLCPMG